MIRFSYLILRIRIRDSAFCFKKSLIRIRDSGFEKNKLMIRFVIRPNHTESQNHMIRESYDSSITANSPYNGYEKKHVLFFQKHLTMMIYKLYFFS